jgi:Ni/Fe-hydrogenase 1 B-type cytochrome subunit
MTAEPIIAPAPRAARVAAEPMVPRVATDPPEPDERVRLYVWQVPVRISHWVLVGSIVVLTLTGFYIANPFLVPPSGPIMTDVRTVHLLSAVALLASGLLRTIWLLAGNRFARWSAFLPVTRAQFVEIFRQAGYYAFLRKEIPKVLGHNQLAASAYVLLFFLIVIEVLTGFVLYGVLGIEPAATLFAWVREFVGLQTIRLLHHLAMWGILAIATFHVYSCILVDNIENNGLLSSIISGYKFPTREEVVESRDGGPELLEEAE